VQDGAMPNTPVLATPLVDDYPYGGDISGQFVIPGTAIPHTVTSFTLQAGFFDVVGSTTLTWYDLGGNVIGQQSNTLIGPETFNVAGVNIASFLMSGADPAGWDIDNVSFELSPVVVDKHWSYTNVAFALDNDGDGLVDEDPVDLIDNDVDGLVDEDPAEYAEYSLGDPLPMDIYGNYVLTATVKNNTIRNINPGQFYAVSTVEVLEDMDELVIIEDYSDVVAADIGELNPVKGGGKVVVVKMYGDTPVEILNANDAAVVVDLENDATVTLQNVVAGEVYIVYVKFSPKVLNGESWPDEYFATNINSAGWNPDGYVPYQSAEATITVWEKGNLVVE